MDKLFLDDDRFPPEDGSKWIIVRCSGEAIYHCLKNGCPEFISFDHDLRGTDRAMFFVHWLVEYDLDHPGFIPDNFSFYIHSQNNIGKDNIEGLLSGYIKHRCLAFSD